MAEIDSPRLQKTFALLNSRGEPAYRRRQIVAAIFRKHVASYRDITELPKELRNALCQALGERVLALTLHKSETAAEAEKVLFELADKERVEAVLLQSAKNDTNLCISTQVGCACACEFCATGAVGFKRHLNPDEIADQVLFFLSRGEDIRGVSLMGMGEPLLNPHIFDALTLLTDKDFIDFSQRNINLSTVGVPPGIRAMTERFPQINLAFSLHSPFPEERSRLVPLNRRYPLSEVMQALDHHIESTHRKVFIVYALLHGLNDTPRHARGLASLLKGRGPASRLYHVNLMRCNPVADDAQYKTDEPALGRFRLALQKAGVKVTVRHSPGRPIEAACGQLYASYPSRPHSTPEQAGE